MKILTRGPSAPQAWSESAVGMFLAGLPNRHGHVVTRGSVIDSWKRKPAHIERRLLREQLERRTA